jgi:hypothetical protein
MFLLEFVLWIAPGSGLMIYICRLVKSKADASTASLRQSAVKTEARLEAAQQAAVLAGEGLAESLANTRQALEVARGIELVDGKVQELTDYLVSKIEGTPGAAEGHGRHTRPGLPSEAPAITGGQAGDLS